MTISSLVAQSSKVAVPIFEVDVQYSDNATEQLVERNEVITLVITVSTPPKSKTSHFTTWDKTTLVKKEIVVNESTLLTINDIMIDKKYENELDNLSISVNAYSSPAPFESCVSKYHDNSLIKGSVKSLKHKKHLFKINVEDDFIVKT